VRRPPVRVLGAGGGPGPGREPRGGAGLGVVISTPPPPVFCSFQRVVEGRRGDDGRLDEQERLMTDHGGGDADWADVPCVRLEPCRWWGGGRFW